MEERLPVSTSHPLFHHPGTPTGLPWCFPASLSPLSPAYVSFLSDQFISSSVIFLQHCFKLVTPLKPPRRYVRLKLLREVPQVAGHSFDCQVMEKSSPPFRMAGCTSQMSGMVELAPPALWNSHLHFCLLFSSCSWHVFWDTLCLFTLLVVVLHVYL